jgi:L-alanine-DL-glutamate epimerase-like enolase superfamily enzyme
MFAPMDAPWKDALAYPPIEVVAGMARIPTGPGLGIELDEAVARAHPAPTRRLNFYSPDSMLEIAHAPR